MAGAAGGLVGFAGRVRRGAAVGLVVAMLPLCAGCYGHFPLTRVVYKANGAVPTKTLKAVTMWAFVPAYAGAMLGDAVVLNPVEFWTDQKIGIVVGEDVRGDTVVLAPSADGREATLTVSRDGAVLGQVRFVRTPGGVCEARGMDGALVGRVTAEPDGTLLLAAASGQVLSAVRPAEWRATPATAH